MLVFRRAKNSTFDMKCDIFSGRVKSNFTYMLFFSEET